jgi:Uma2 family endonuclease
MTANKYLYPDVSVFCEPLTFYDNNPDAANNPTLIVEVLSETTSDYDRSGKFMRYRQIPSFREYILIETRYPFVEVFTKNETNIWEYRTYETLTDTIKLFSIDVEISMADIYLKIEFLNVI